MATTLQFFMTAEDEVAFLRAIEPVKFEVFPEAWPRDFRPFVACAGSAPLVTDDAYYLALPSLGEMVTREIRRGPHKGMREVDEVRSPVMHWERSRVDEDGELRSGRIWAELEIAGDRQKLMTKPDLLRSAFDRLRAVFRKHYHHSDPAGFFVGPFASRRAHEGLVLREAGRKGETVVPFK
jgi:hypothetical protein